MEIFLGGESGEATLGSRYFRGKVGIFDSYKFTNNTWTPYKHHFRSIDTWLDGICKSHCSEHPWILDSGLMLDAAAGKRSIFNEDSDDENAGGYLDDDDDELEHEHQHQCCSQVQIDAAKAPTNAISPPRPVEETETSGGDILLPKKDDTFEPAIAVPERGNISPRSNNPIGSQSLASIPNTDKQHPPKNKRVGTKSVESLETVRSSREKGPPPKT